MVPSFPWCLWNCSICLKGKSQMTSLFRTKNGSLSLVKCSLAKANGPAVTIKQKMLIWNSYLDQNVNVSHLGSAIIKKYVNLKFIHIHIWTKMWMTAILVLYSSFYIGNLVLSCDTGIYEHCHFWIIDYSLYVCVLTLLNPLHGFLNRKTNHLSWTLLQILLLWC